ncbi:MAG: RNA methyltransferase [Victivallales bacterium]
MLANKHKALIKSLYTRHGRKKHDLCVCEGLRCCRELLALRPELVSLPVCSEDFDVSSLGNVTFEKISRSEFDSLSATVIPQGCLIVVRKPAMAANDVPPADPFIMALDRVSDPGNLGTIIRTVRAVGLKELWLTEGTADPFSDKVIRSALASQFAVRMRLFPGLDEMVCELRGFGYDRVYKTDPDGKASCFDEKNLFLKSALVFGSEAHGAGDVEGAIPLVIPMPGKIESINVAQAATVILFEAVRRGIFK